MDLMVKKEKLEEATQNKKYSSDMIDLWQVILLLIKHKLQIFVFVMIGVVISSAIVWERERMSKATQLPEEINLKREYYTNVYEKLKYQKDKKLKKIFKLLNKIQSNKPISEIVAAQYTYKSIDHPDEFKKFNLTNFKSFNPNFMRIGSSNYHVNLLVKKSNTSVLKEELKSIYTDLSTKNQSIGRIHQKKIDAFITYVNDQKGNNDAETVDTKKLHKMFAASVRSDLSKWNSEIVDLEKAITDKVTKASKVLYSLSEQSYIDVNEDFIPLSVWMDLSNQVHRGRKFTSRQGYQIASEIALEGNAYLETVDSISRYFALKNIFNSNDRMSNELVAFIELELKSNKVFIEKPEPPRYSNKVVYLFFTMCMLIVGSLSVFVRVYLESQKGNGKFVARKAELSSALRFWKI